MANVSEHEPFEHDGGPIGVKAEGIADWRAVADCVARSDSDGAERAARLLLERSGDRVRQHYVES